MLSAHTGDACGSAHSLISMLSSAQHIPQQLAPQSLWDREAAEAEVEKSELYIGIASKVHLPN